MDILRQDQLWGLARDHQAELYREARAAQLRKALLPQRQPWWKSLAQRLQRPRPVQAAPDIYGEAAGRTSAI